MADDDLMTATQSRVLPVTYDGDEAFSEAWNESTGALVLPSTVPTLVEGQRLALSIQVGARPGRVVVRATVGPLHSTGAWTVKVRADDLPRLEKARRLLTEGTKAPVRVERLTTDDVPVEILYGGAMHPARVRDVSQGGCYVSCAAPLPRQQEAVVLSVKPPGALFFKLKLKGRVTWLDTAEGAPGFGIAFDAGQHDKVEKFLFTMLVED